MHYPVLSRFFQRHMSRRDLFRTGAAAAGLTLLRNTPWPAWAEAQETPKKGGTLIIAWEADPDVLVPGASTAGATARANRLIYDTLIQEDLTKSVMEVVSPPLVPGLAESWTISPDRLTYTFRIRQGINFHDGTPLDAEAIKFNFDRAMRPDFAYFDSTAKSILNPFYKWIKEVQAADKYTLRITLHEPFASILLSLANPNTGIISPTAIKKWGNEQLGAHPTGSGPFKFVERERGVKVVLERNPQYWGGAPYLDQVIIRPIIEDSSRIAALQAREVDMVVVVPPDSVQLLAATKDIDVVFAGPPHIWFWMLNCRSTPTKDKRVRQAMNYAVNKEALTRDILKGTAIPAKGPFPPGNPAYNPEVQGYPYDPDKAKRLLKEAGYPDGFDMKCFFAISGSGMMVPVPMNTFIQGNLRDVGIKVSFETLEFAAFIAKARKGLDDETSALQTSWGSNDMYWLEQMFHSSLHPPNGNVRTWYKNEQVDALLAQARGEVDHEKRVKLYQEAEKLIIEDAPWLFVTSDRAPKAYHKSVRGFVSAPSWYFDLTKVWLA